MDFLHQSWLTLKFWIGLCKVSWGTGTEVWSNALGTEFIIAT
jgi:hypothetical protein